MRLPGGATGTPQGAIKVPNSAIGAPQAFFVAFWLVCGSFWEANMVLTNDDPPLPYLLGYISAEAVFH